MKSKKRPQRHRVRAKMNKWPLPDIIFHCLLTCGCLQS